MFCALLMGGAVCCVKAAATGGMERDDYAGTEKAVEGQDSYNVTEWQDSIPLDEVESAFRSMQGEESSFSIKEYVEDIMAGRASFSLAEIWNKGITTIGDRNLGEMGFYVTY